MAIYNSDVDNSDTCWMIIKWTIAILFLSGFVIGMIYGIINHDPILYVAAHVCWIISCRVGRYW